MFSRSDSKPLIDLSAELADELDWKAGPLRTFEHRLDVTAWSYDAISGLLAIGTSQGTIDIFGGPGVEHRIRLDEPGPVRVTGLMFLASPLKLFGVVDYQRLFVWDLTSPNTPKLQGVQSFRSRIEHVTSSPSHTHAFIALNSGEVETYDLLCSRKSPYTIPNLWKMYQEKIPNARPPHRDDQWLPIPYQLCTHPRDLNLLFIVYGGGVILSDLSQRKILRAYELALPPGAQGGIGYHDPDLMKERWPMANAITVHPCGHFFAVGYTDGSVAFWAIEDEDKPLLVLTVDGMHDINIVNANELDAVLSNPPKAPAKDREPIMRLAWSGFPNSDDPRGGHTVLTVIGGLRADDAQGVVTLLLPPFNPPEPPALAAPSNALHPDIRAAMRQSVMPIDVYTYPTVGLANDFMLLPRGSPHFSWTWDPYGIMLMSNEARGLKAVEAYEFPPPQFGIASTEHKTTAPAPQPPSSEASAEDALSQEIESTLADMKLNDDAKSLVLPPALWSGSSSVVGGDIVSLDKESYGALVSGDESSEPSIRFRGGAAWVEDLQGQLRLIRFQPQRILITYHQDLTVRFRDLSSQLLLSTDTNPMQSHFPNPLPTLTIDVLVLLADASLTSSIPPELAQDANIASVHLATQSLECAVVLRGGEVALFRHGSLPNEGPRKILSDKELVSTAHITPDYNRRFHPMFLLITRRGPPSALSLSDIGFLAVAYKDGSLFIIDMRGPKIIKRETGEKQHFRRSLLQRPETDVVQSLTWTVAGTDIYIVPRVRLISVRESGYTTIYTLSRSPAGEWSVDGVPDITESVPHALPGASFVIHTKTGAPIKADRGGLAEVLTTAADAAPEKKSYWISAGAKGVKCVVDITGDRVGKADWPSKDGKIESVGIVRKSNATVLVAHTDQRLALVYSLPSLELMHSIQVPKLHQRLHTDDTGDYIEWLPAPNTNVRMSGCRYGTLFNVRRSDPYDPPSVDFTYGRGVVPPQPQPVSVGPTSIVGSWLGYLTSKTMTGDQIDALLAGPDRPIPAKKLARASSPEAGSSTTGSQDPSGSSLPSAQNIANSASRGANDLYGRLNNALAERGEMLSGLQESFDALEAGSKNMLSQAKSLAAQQTAKRWFQW